MDKVKLLQLMVVILLALNIVVLALQFGPRMGPPPGGIEKQFDFSEEQVKAFEKSRDAIQSKLRDLNPRLEKVSQEYYNEIDRELANSTILPQIQELNAQIYEAHHLHFEDIRAICNDEQVKSLPDFIGQLMRGRPRGPQRRR